MSSASTALPTVPVYDYAIFLTLTALSLGTGLYLSLRRRGRGISTRDEAFLGSRSLHAIPLAMSMVATNVTAMGTIGWVAYFYQYGFHTYWCIPAFVPAGLLVVCFVLPVLYELRVTSIFEQTSGAAGIYSAAIALATTFGISLSVSTILIGVAGTTYTALGGLRSVVWADCVQAVIMTAAPLTIIGKIVYDSVHSATPPRPLSDLNFSEIIVRTEFDFTTDETVWAAFLGAFPVQLMRVGLDQVIAQRFLAARSLKQARISQQQQPR
ncbi:sodium-dependent multivitamin transporter-like [Rhipicephalus sanguineus]|uniref:sodium-dependent multivitamin transporter-like n=1 Tax=Rhipicephalus sanguineus TaxID=34632 RepID=UPI0020C49B29|nr:sodium-dependent multivitamin transporter-like [Rhipicephalus sanguineus]